MNLNKQILEAIQRGVNLAIDDFDVVQDIEVQKTGQIKHSLNTRELIKYSYFVDLDLPSGILWGKYNVDVDPTKLNMAQDWYGGYYAWGEIEEKQDYNWKTYMYGDYNRLTKYCNNDNSCANSIKPDNLTTLQDEDDIAVQTNKLSWNVKMPTKKQFEELIIYTTNKWVENYQGISGLSGRVFTSTRNGNVLFIPAAGYRRGSSVRSVGSNCLLWLRSLYEVDPNYAYYLQINSSERYIGAYHRSLGFSVRSILIK